MTKEEVIRLRNIAAFIALMSNGQGLIDKSPTYILEKFNRYCISTNDEAPWGLDFNNMNKVKAWEEYWIKDDVKKALGKDRAVVIKMIKGEELTDQERYDEGLAKIDTNYI